MVARSKRPRGRPRGDLALVLRNQIWGRAVYERSGLSWDALDTQFLGEPADSERPRAFWWIARIGVDPRSPKRKRSELDLVDAVDEADGFKGLKGAYESELWTLLTPPQSHWTDRAIISKRLLEKMELFRAEFPMRHAAAFAFPDEPAFRPWEIDATRWMTERLKEPTLDLVALLALSFQRALGDLDLQEADCYLRAIGTCLPEALRRLHSTEKVKGRLQSLVVDRLLRNDWTSSEEDARQSPRKSRAKNAPREDENALRRFGDPSSMIQAAIMGKAKTVRSSPIVPMTTQLQEILDRQMEWIELIDGWESRYRYTDQPT